MILGRAEFLYGYEHSENRPIIETSDDVDALIDSLLANPESKNMAEVYSMERELLPAGVPDHQFLVGVRKGLQVGIVSFMDEAGRFVSLGSGEDRGAVDYHIAGHQREFPARSEIPIELVRRAVKEFLGSRGARPTCVQWQDHEI